MTDTSNEYARELARKEQDRLQLRSLLLAGASSARLQDRLMGPISIACAGKSEQTNPTLVATEKNKLTN